VRVEYDPEADAAYIYLDETAQHGRSVPLSDVLPQMIVFDYAGDDRLTGIEVMGASQVLPIDFLKRFANRSANPA
jgi:uncharacterized protein YuzE